MPLGFGAEVPVATAEKVCLFLRQEAKINRGEIFRLDSLVYGRCGTTKQKGRRGEINIA